MVCVSFLQKTDIDDALSERGNSGDGMSPYSVLGPKLTETALSVFQIVEKMSIEWPASFSSHLISEKMGDIKLSESLHRATGS